MANRDEIISRQAARGLLGRRIECLLEPRDKVIRLLGQSEFGVGEIALVLPAGRIINQVGKRHMPSTLRQIDVTRPQAIADGHGETEFPGPTIDGGVRLVQGRVKLPGDKRRGGLRGQGLQRAVVELLDQIEPFENSVTPGLTLEG